MNDLFLARMHNKINSNEYSNTLAAHTLNDANIIENATFANDPNYHYGKLYDWDMKPIDNIDYKLQKSKSFSTETDIIDYTVQFRPRYNPEQLFKQADGRERSGFYIDVPEIETGKQEVNKWLIYGKDDRHAFDRYIALKCNWMFEWVIDDPNNYKRTYQSCMGVIRDSSNETASVWRDTLVTNTVQQIYFLVPTNAVTRTLDYNMRLMICDNALHPKVYEVCKLSDVIPFGITKVVLKQCLYNSHTDFCGTNDDLNKCSNNLLNAPLTDLPVKFGGKNHKICDVLKSNGINPSKNQDSDSPNPVVTPDTSAWTLSKVGDSIQINANPIVINAKYNGTEADKANYVLGWHIFMDGTEYSVSDLQGYFDISINDNSLSIKPISRDVLKYIVKIAVYDTNKTYYDSVEMEVIN